MDRKAKIDLYQRVTDQIIAAIEAGTGDPVMPWHRSGLLSLPKNVKSGAFYNGINILNLWCALETRGYTHQLWGTYRQWASLDAQVVKGAKSSLVIFYKEVRVEGEDEGATETRRIAKMSFVFNVDQVEGYELRLVEAGDPVERIARAETYVGNIGATIRHGGDGAYWRASSDVVQMPDDRLFQGTKTSTRTESYYGVLFHELVHWTSSAQRCGRELGKRFGDRAYAAEELVAELGAAFECAALGITLEPRVDHAQYVRHWLELLKEDKKAIFTAAARASEAVQYLDRLQPDWNV